MYPNFWPAPVCFRCWLSYSRSDECGAHSRRVVCAMNTWNDSVLVFLVLTNFILLGSSRPPARIRLTAIQGLLLGILTILVHADDIPFRTLLLAMGSMTVKAGIFPWLLRRAVRVTDVRRGV